MSNDFRWKISVSDLGNRSTTKVKKLQSLNYTTIITRTKKKRAIYGPSDRPVSIHATGNQLLSRLIEDGDRQDLMVHYRRVGRVLACSGHCYLNLTLYYKGRTLPAAGLLARGHLSASGNSSHIINNAQKTLETSPLHDIKENIWICQEHKLSGLMTIPRCHTLSFCKRSIVRYTMTRYFQLRQLKTINSHHLTILNEIAKKYTVKFGNNKFLTKQLCASQKMAIN